MEIPVLVEPVENNGYRARSGEPLLLEARGATAEEAVNHLKTMLAGRMAAGATVVSVSIPGTNHPWLPFAGTLKDDPLLDDWIRAMADYRQAVENDPNYL
jgi:hypothetical protein